MDVADLNSLIGELFGVIHAIAGFPSRRIFPMCGWRRSLSYKRWYAVAPVKCALSTFRNTGSSSMRRWM